MSYSASDIRRSDSFVEIGYGAQPGEKHPKTLKKTTVKEKKK
jgi:hypothetical protein